MSGHLHPYASFVHRVQKPARYLGGELYSVIKRPETHPDVQVRICLTFPDIYDIGMSHLGTKILYGLLNDHENIACERAFTPWIDMEAELRQRKLELVSLETAAPLRSFDVLGFSLQYELTYTNALTILDLGGMEVRSANRSEDDPLVLAGGPTATHPEACAPFFDAFLVGDAEARLPDLLLAYKADRTAGLSKREALIRMAQAGGVYVPALYDVAIDERSGLQCVSGVQDPRVPEVVERAFVEDINLFPFPSKSPVAAAEAIFDRLSVEIARGCTEGCRFCQAGMIYRPVRERDPDAIVNTIVEAIDQGGYDEASLSSLSTADYSCIDPLIRKVMGKLRERNVSLGVASLRAYGLSEGILDEIRSVRATGLTFAPEAGTQRMRDIVNKNVSEEDIATSAHRVFSRGWNRMKVYFMIGLPMEEDEDVAGIVETGARLKAIGRQYVGKRAEVGVSVSSHVPKPHTPFQWAAMDEVPEIKRKQQMLREMARYHRVTVKYHNVKVSWLEGIMARGDRRVADVVEAAWRKGARFDGWDDQLKWEIWLDVFEATPHVDPQVYLNTLPLDGRLPWDHIDMGLADGFLETEWKRTTKGKLSPPCGKPVGDIIHHTNLKDAAADERKLVCYHCGVACDLTEMRGERLRYLDQMRAYEPPPEAAPMDAPTRDKRGHLKPPKRDVAQPEDMVKYRVQYLRDGMIRLQGHSDMLRILPRVMRRAGLPLGQSWGFRPKPLFSFSPATPLGTYSVAEVLDVSLTEAYSADDVLKRLNAVADPGLTFLDCRLVQKGEAAAGSGLAATDYLIALPGLDQTAVAQAARKLMKADTWEFMVTRKKTEKPLDARAAVEMARLTTAAMWPKLLGEAPDAPLLHVRLTLNVPAAKPLELIRHMFDDQSLDGHIVRLAYWRDDKDGKRVSPMDPPLTPAPALESADADGETAVSADVATPVSDLTSAAPTAAN
ncbi:MAG: radical SAM family uncharacterized protein/radical SAM-linked protein [Myxococcota bacterium]|jgi:radical SAM family uncharacterized protein/radical SAM-linked protein